MKKEITEIIKYETEILPCIKCGCENIRIYNCGYSSFNCAGGECTNPKCKYKVETHADWTAKDAELIKAWNKENDPEIQISKSEEEILILRNEIKRLKVLKKKYNGK